jgi:hypothetical protein
MVQRDFIPYEQALELKELGFDEPCFGKIYADGGSEQLSYPYKNSDQIGKVTSCSAPLYQQVFRWFRVKYNAHIYPQKFTDNSWWVEWGDWESPVFETYEEAELECLNKLIEIAKL